MNPKILVLFICVEAMIYLLLYNLTVPLTYMQNYKVAKAEIRKFMSTLRLTQKHAMLIKEKRVYHY